MISWFDARSAKQFGTALADFVVAGSAGEQRRNEKKAAAAAEKLAHEVARRVAEFRQKEAPNFYQKSQLGNEFRWALQKGGVAPERIEAWITFVLSRL